jgi:hypothetical protein
MITMPELSVMNRDNIVENIHLDRGVDVMPDHDIARLYGVETRRITGIKPQSKLCKQIPQDNYGVLYPPTSSGLFDLQISVRATSKICVSRINEQVKRNMDRFPEAFMFQLTKEEFENLKSHFAISSWGGRRSLSFAFTEHGILMPANVIKSERAIKVSIRLIEVFVKIREFFLSRRDIEIRLEKAEGSLEKHEGVIIEILKYIRQIEKEKQVQRDQNNRTKIGLKTSNDETGNG